MGYLLPISSIPKGMANNLQRAINAVTDSSGFIDLGTNLGVHYADTG